MERQSAKTKERQSVKTMEKEGWSLHTRLNSFPERLAIRNKSLNRITTVASSFSVASRIYLLVGTTKSNYKQDEAAFKTVSAMDLQFGDVMRYVNQPLHIFCLSFLLV